MRNASSQRQHMKIVLDAVEAPAQLKVAETESTLSTASISIFKPAQVTMQCRSGLITPSFTATE